MDIAESIRIKLWEIFKVYNQFYNNKLKLNNLCCNKDCIFRDSNNLGTYYVTHSCKNTIYVLPTKDFGFTFLHELSHLIHLQIYGMKERSKSHNKNFNEILHHLKELRLCFIHQGYFKHIKIKYG